MAHKHDYKECAPSRVKAYKGLRVPRCNGGIGCRRCWNKYEQEKAVRRSVMDRFLSQTPFEVYRTPDIREAF